MYRVHPTQVKAARGFLGWTQEQLAENSGVSMSTIRSFESGFTPRASTIDQLRRTFEKFGVEFTDDEGIRPRKEGILIYQGPDSCDRLFDDITQTVKELNCDVLAFLRTHEVRSQPCGLTPKSNFERLRSIQEIADIKCLLADMPKPPFVMPSFQIRLLAKDIIGPSSFYVYGDKLVTAQLDIRMNFIYVVYRIVAVAQDWRTYFDLMWEVSPPPPIPASETSRENRQRI